MTRPLMVVVAGPSGSGKSHHFPVDRFGVDAFNIDARAAAYNVSVARDVFERIELYDNSAWFAAPRLVGRVGMGELVSLAEPLPAWVSALTR